MTRSRFFYGALIALALFVGAGLLIARLNFAPYGIPSGSMKPSLEINDYALVSIGAELPERGEIVVFRHPGHGQTFVKRLIGLPGDTVQLLDGALIINGQEASVEEVEPYVEVFQPQGRARLYPRCANGPVVEQGECVKIQMLETLPSGASYRVLSIAKGAMFDTTPKFTVDDGHFFVLGDNRDNSADSRLPTAVGGVGQVPIENLIGKVVYVLEIGR
ncbi:MAG: signal peptidase I [Rhodobacteraceae bacterium]|nr:signal peptidase I [Paracoccaceae bacterium]